MINPQNMDIVSNFITASIILTVMIEVWEATRPMKLKGKGLLLLLGDAHLLGAVPWVIYVFMKNASFMDIFLPIALGVLLAIPLILSTKFISTEKGTLRFKQNGFLYLFLIGIPFLRRYVGFNWFFKHHLVFFPNTHVPNIELMIVMYVTVIVVNIYAWRIVSYLKFRQIQRALLHGQYSE
jgi:hypothetical protein